MNRPTLYIGNKNYSSWSFRPWMALTGAGVDFEEILIPFDYPGGNPDIKAISPTGRVPLLQHGGLRIWESLAIIEYAAELYPDAGLLPADRADRALARSVSMEMLSSFRALRNACPMNIRRPRGKIALPEGIEADIGRIEAIWRDLLQKSGGPFLFGAFSGVDPMFAPVVNRFDVYDLVSQDDTLAYMKTMKAHPAWRKWEEAARAEPWIVAEVEV
ncbi:glutathione S-transferase family protein [Rhizobium binae]|uniref:glutathione S-transferase family protein n=1 Tax=Rhizobium binae TaxID=1138190 RepID=UPI001C830360|nr:glutathione S-transferase family protein [Rhizobium binae]MBX4925575.1 glutathione S-transferase family protein [Rhizobium binae]MBX4971320.1 glutathione S-transferase family protein [Rhizobium binae]